jgi:hypothetical protein
MTTVYCGSCGASLSQTAKFCRACGNSQEVQVAPVATAPPPPSPTASLPPIGYAPPPPPGPPPPALTSTRTGEITSVAAVLALVGGIGICALALYSLAYLPFFKYDTSYVYDDLPRLCDLLTLATGLLAAGFGVQMLRRAVANPSRAGLVLLAFGVPALVLTLLSVFPDTFHIETYPIPFYLAYNYLPDVLGVEVDYRYIPVPLLASLGVAVLSGVTMLFAPGRPAAASSRR